MRTPRVIANLLRIAGAAVAVAGGIVLVGCSPNPERRELEFLPDMYRNPALKPQEQYAFLKFGNSNLMPPAGTIPVGFTTYPYRITEGARAGEELANPLPMTQEVLLTGRKYYSIHCAVCHGDTGAGNGLVTLAYRENGMPIPPSLYTDKIREWKDGELYHTITMGQGQMPAYGSRIDPANRWAIVHYVRALGEAAAPSEAALQEAQRLGSNASETDPYRVDNPRHRRNVYRLDFPTNTDR